MPAVVFYGMPSATVHLTSLTIMNCTAAAAHSPLAEQVVEPEMVETRDELIEQLDQAGELHRQAITEHDPEDWYRQPSSPRSGPWGDQPTLVRFARPFNDFTNHLGSIRAIRRLNGNSADRTQ